MLSIARKTEFVKRERLLKPIDFVRGLMGGALRGVGITLEGLLQDSGSEISKVALHNRFTAEAVNLMQEVFVAAFRAQYWENENGYQKTLGQFRRVLIFDSSAWNVPASLATVFPGNGGSSSAATCKMQVGYELKSGTFIEHKLMENSQPDQSYAENISEFAEAGDLALFDLGYATPTLLEGLDENDVFFVARFKADTILISERGELINLVKVLKEVRRRGRNRNIEFPACIRANGLKLRVVATRLSSRDRQRRLAQLTDKKRKPLSSRAKELAGWCIYITNSPVELLPSATVGALYRLRWSIELLFKQLKSILKLDQITHANENRLRCEVLAKLIVASISCKLHARLQSVLYHQEEQELSIHKVFLLIRKKADRFLSTLFYGTAGATAFFAELRDSIMKWGRKECSRSKPTTFQRIAQSLNAGPRFQNIRISHYA